MNRRAKQMLQLRGGDDVGAWISRELLGIPKQTSRPAMYWAK